MTGTPMAAYSSSFVLSEYSRYGSAQRRHEPDVGAGQQARQVVDRHAAVERHAVGGAGPLDGLLDPRPPRAVAVDVEAPVAGRGAAAASPSIATSRP